MLLTCFRHIQTPYTRFSVLVASTFATSNQATRSGWFQPLPANNFPFHSVFSTTRSSFLCFWGEFTVFNGPKLVLMRWLASLQCPLWVWDKLCSDTSYMPLAMSSVVLNQQYRSNKVSINRNAHKTGYMRWWAEGNVTRGSREPDPTFPVEAMVWYSLILVCDDFTQHDYHGWQQVTVCIHQTSR